MKKLSYLIVLVLILGMVLTGCSLLSNVGQVPVIEQTKVKPTGNASAEEVAWHLSDAVMPAPYGSGDIDGSDTASKLIVNQPNGSVEVAVTGAMNGLTPETTYTVYLSKEYYTNYWPGLFTSTVPEFTFTTDADGAGSWHINLRDSDFPGPGIHTLSVWINDTETHLTILISDNFKVVVDVTGSSCTTIQDGTLLTSDGTVITTGYDEWGYDYQAHIFNGGYCDSYRNADWCQPYRDTQLIMKWNDAWLSNMDCDGDGLLDRHYGFDSYIGSGAWLTNHMWGTYEDNEGNLCEWNYFCKIVAAPSDATKVDDCWVNADGTVIGPVIWGAFAVIQEVENDPCAGISGLQYNSPAGPGFGQYLP